jgi:hypothetical protein
MVDSAGMRLQKKGGGGTRQSLSLIHFLGIEGQCTNKSKIVILFILGNVEKFYVL